MGPCVLMCSPWWARCARPGGLADLLAASPDPLAALALRRFGCSPLALRSLRSLRADLPRGGRALRARRPARRSQKLALAGGAALSVRQAGRFAGRGAAARALAAVAVVAALLGSASAPVGPGGSPPFADARPGPLGPSGGSRPSPAPARPLGRLGLSRYARRYTGGPGAVPPPGLARRAPHALNGAPPANPTTRCPKSKGHARFAAASPPLLSGPRCVVPRPAAPLRGRPGRGVAGPPAVVVARVGPLSPGGAGPAARA